jgi:hypothetical protein
MLQALKSGFRTSTVYILVFSVASLILYYSVTCNAGYNFIPYQINYNWNTAFVKILNTALFLTATFILFLCTAHDDLIKKHNFIPFTLYVILQPLVMNQNGLDFNIIHQTLLLLALRLLFNTYRKDKQERRLFDAGFFLGLDVLICQKGLGIILFFLIVLYQLRAIKIKEWVAVVFGYFMPLVIYLISNWIINEQFLLINFFNWNFFWPHGFDFNSPLLYTQILLLCISILAFEFIFKIKSGVYAKQHTFHQAFILMLVWTTILCFSIPNSPFNWLAYNLILVCFCVGEFIGLSKREAFWNSALYFIILCIYAETLQDRWHWF